ncbi:MAG TPA: ester cyclase [Mycobacteriales bacterium]|nr:ester cyclase [Mycobacteriales bacterium]
MSTDQIARNKEIYHRFHGATDSGDLDHIDRVIDELVAPDVDFHAPLPMGTTATDALKLVWRTLIQAFPDIRVTVEDVIAEGQKVVARQTVTGTHRGEYRGHAPTGRSVRYNEIFILRFEDGRIAEIWGVVDVLTQLKQLGLVADHQTV